MISESSRVIVSPGNQVPVAAANAIGSSGEPPQSIADIRQETQIWTAFELNPYLRALDLKAFVRGGTATLSGFVTEGIHKELAKLIAIGVSGITQVDNQIFIESDCLAPTPSSERSYGEMIEDANITAAIKSKLMWSQYSNGLSTDVDTLWGKVTLSGSVDSDTARSLAGRLALNTHGVVSVVNQLEVSLGRAALEHNAAVAAHDKARDIADSWISTKIRSTFLYSSNINSHEIVVNTHEGVVTLSGRVGSIVERAFAIELAQHIRGVESVISDELHC